MCVESKRIRVMIADDSSEMRRGLTTFIEFVDDFELVGIAATGAEAVALCATARPEIILMDLVMPEMDGLTATRLLRRQFPEVKVIALTSFPQELVHAALLGEVCEYLTKDVSADALTLAIRRAAGRNCNT